MKLILILTMIALVGFLGVALTVAAQSPAPQIDLVWQAETYTPASYEGRALPTTGSEVVVTGLAYGADGRVNNNYDWRWEKDGYQIHSASGLGKNVLRFRTGNPRTAHQIKVALHDSAGKRLAETSTTILVSEPRVMFYQEEAWGVDYSRALVGTLRLAQAETKILAEPFYFSRSAVANRGLGYDWRLNSESLVANTEDARRFSLLLPDPLPESAKATLELRIVNLAESLQKASHSLLATYGQD